MTIVRRLHCCLNSLTISGNPHGRRIMIRCLTRCYQDLMHDGNCYDIILRRLLRKKKIVKLQADPYVDRKEYREE